MIPVHLTGGLHLMSVAVAAKAGSLRDCLNYEVSTVDGYTRIGGLLPFDGQPAPHSMKFWRLKYVGTAGGFAAGDEVRFEVGQSGYVLETAVDINGVHVLYTVFGEWAEEPSLPATLTNVTQGGTQSISVREVVTEPRGTQGVLNTAVHTLTEFQRANITSIPGRPGSDVIGMFWFKDRCYAIRDLPRIYFEGGYYTEANEGQYVTYSGDTYRILNVTITGDQQGILTLDPVPGVGVIATPLVAASLAEIPVTGDLGDAYTGIAYSDALSTSGGVPPYSWSLLGEEGTSIVPVSAPDLSAIEFLPHTTDAAMYRSTPTGWERVYLGRELRFRNGGSELRNFTRGMLLDGTFVDDTAATFPTGGTINGVATAALNADDGSEAALTGANGDVFVATGFDFSTVPDGATIVGITVTIERHSDTAAQARDETVDLVGITGGTQNKAKGDKWPNAAAAVSYGGNGDTWGSQAITAAAIKAAGFGVRVMVQRDDPGVACIGGIDYINVTVHYIRKDAKVYFWDGTTDVEATLRHVQILDGDTITGNAIGWMNILADVNADKPRLVNEGDEIRDEPLGAGNVLALVSSRDRPIWMPGQVEIDNNRSRYLFVNTNFYGQDDYDAVYGVSGAGPAFSWDGVRLIRIRTALPPTVDLPRHIARHGSMLFLGYFSGALVHSAVGDPFEMRASIGAAGIEVGDRLTNLRPLSGDALGVVCQSGTYALRGTSPTTFFMSPISSVRGGIEYTAADVGRVVLCDGFGIFAADTPESFGAAQRTYLSTDIEPWLRERLQAPLNAEQSYIRPVTALAVRNKNQYRLFFWDGYVLTMTLTEPQQFTIQRYFTQPADEHTEATPWTIRAVASGINSSGRERLFVSFYGGIKEGQVFEIDVGNTFDGESLPHYLELNPFVTNSGAHETRVDRLFVHGIGHGVATLNASRGVNYIDPDPDNALQFVLGKSTDRSRGKPKPFRGVVDFPIEGYDVTWRFEGASMQEGPHTLQFLNLLADDRGGSRGNVRD